LAIVHEAEVLSRLEHPNIARLIGLDYANRSAGLLTEFVSGSTLDSQLAHDFDRRAPQLVELIVQLCQAVSAVHGAGFVHGDISSGNILVAPDNRLVLIDFGESRPIGAPSTPARATPDFAAPELFRGAPASIASDIYSLGVLMSLLVRSQIDKHLSGTSHAAAALCVPQETRSTLLDVIERATESDPSRRYGTVEEVLSAVQRLADGVDIRIIQLMLGHASVQQTQRYLNVTDEELRRGLEVSWKRARALRLVQNHANPAHDCPQIVTTGSGNWCARQDSNLRPLASEANALSS
jgi:serine/threonine protein kinase